ncbi:MAG TPA: META domain-containing protein [Ferruginibacter sp.]|nr:META domain-containing protein [Ferruginibacter sp.]HMP20769.1 META domain-containing protein [Ferruginibacter sp.]
MKKIRLFSTVIFCLVMYSNCSNTKKTTTAATADSDVLFKNLWKLTEINGEKVPSASKAMLEFTQEEGGRVSGNTGCNRITGTYTLGKDNAIQFGSTAITRMACLDNTASAIETKLASALKKATSWQADSNELLLKNGDVVLAKLAARKPLSKEEMQLNGTWQLTYISGPKIAFEGLFPNKKPTIIFDFPEAQAHGNGGCNGYSAKVTVVGSTISFGDALSTMMACEGNGEPVYFKTLKTITSYRIEGNTLTMNMGEVPVLKFEKSN